MKNFFSKTLSVSFINKRFIKKGVDNKIVINSKCLFYPQIKSVVIGLVIKYPQYTQFTYTYQQLYPQLLK